MTKAIGLCAFLLVTANTVAGAEPDLSDGGIPHLRIVNSKSYINVADREVTYAVGERLPLFQKNQAYYIAYMEDPLDGPILCAFPRTDRKGRGTAWVTKENELVFGINAASCQGRYYFRPGETMPLLEQTDTRYHVRIEQFGHSVDMPVPLKSVRAEVTYIKEPPPKRSKKIFLKLAAAVDGQASQPPPPHPVKSDGLYTPSISEVTGFESRITGRLRAQGRATSTEAVSEPAIAITILPPADATPPDDPVVEDVRDEVALVSEVAEPLPSDQVEIAATTREDDEALPDPVSQVDAPPTEPVAVEVVEVIGDATEASLDTPVAPRPESEPPVVEVQEPTPEPTGFLAFLEKHNLLFKLLLLTVLLQALFIVHLKKQKQKAAAQNPGFETYSSFGESVFTDSMQGTDDGVFSGTLSGLSMGELVQFLHSARETGRLAVSSADDLKIRNLYFSDGEIIDALWGETDGEDAVLEIFRLKDGTFTFLREEELRHRTVAKSTMSLLLNAHKEMDEQAPQETATVADVLPFQPEPKEASKPSASGLRLKQRDVS